MRRLAGGNGDGTFKHGTPFQPVNTMGYLAVGDFQPRRLLAPA
jgi:hypothetical protein